MVTLIWQFTQIWNDFLFAVTLTNGAGQTATVALGNLVKTSQATKRYDVEMAAAIITLPALIRSSQARRDPIPAWASSFCNRTPSGSWTSTGGSFRLRSGGGPAARPPKPWPRASRPPPVARRAGCCPREAPVRP